MKTKPDQLAEILAENVESGQKEATMEVVERMCSKLKERPGPRFQETHRPHPGKVVKASGSERILTR